MHKETVSYVDYNGVERTETFYFNLTEAELAEMQLTTEGGLANMIQEIVETKDLPKIIELFKRIIRLSYGKKSPDGRRFIKNDETLDDFLQTEAYSTIFMRLATDEAAASKFINETIPQNLVSRANAQKAEITSLPVGE